MKLLHVVHNFDAADAGGTERYTRSLTAELARRHQVEVFTFRLDPQAERIRTERSTVAAGVDVVTVVRRSGRGLRDRLGAQRAIEAAFAEHLRASRPDVVHFQHLTGLSPGLVKVPGRLAIPAVLTLHDFWFLCPRIHLIRKDGSVCTTGPRGGFACMANCGPATDALGPSAPRHIPAPTDAAFVARYLRSRAGLRAAPALIAPSAFVRDFYVREGLDADRIRVIPHGLDPMEPAPPRSPRRPVRFGFLGLVSTLKGVDRLLDVFQRIDPDQAMLDLHGPLEPNEAPAFRDRVAELPAVTMHGPYGAAELPSILAGLDVVLNVSRAMETFSFVAREALAHGVPVVASRSGAMPEAVRDGEDGYLVSGEPELLERIRSLIANPAEIERLSANARRTRPPSTAQHAATLEALYRELAG
jgi:glycosyltransferase involved in cell wall biosynthesis